ncbi:zinc finger protein 660-like [Eurosta solidaginis]|uniref:zinc finger protein 660-like n=1 Tax=Eurosta solidaginis TaxID=178769 RepID=UPI003530D402
MDARSEQFFDCMCRTCMKELVEVYSNEISTKPEQQWQYLFDTIEECESLPIAELLSSTIPQIQVQPTDELPKKICRKCLEQLLNLHSFQQTCVQSQRQLRDLIANINVDFKITKTESSSEDKITANEYTVQEFVAEGKVPSIEFGLLNQLSEASQSSSPVDPLQSYEETNECTDVSDFVKIEVASVDESNIEHSDSERIHSVITIKDEVQIKTTNQKISLPLLTYTCPLCNKSFQQTRYLKSHLKSHKKPDESEQPKNVSAYFRFKCDVCQRRFHKQESLDLHRLTHDEKADKKEPTCDICERTYSTQKNLNKHKRIWHPVEKLPTEKPLHSCNQCSKTFKKMYLLKAHLRVHTGERPYLCPECGKAFKTSDQMRAHHLRHSDVKAYECPHCPLKFRSSGDVSKHKVIHRAIKRYVCDLCGDRFAKSNQLTVHKRFHNGEKPFKCDYCEMRFVHTGPLQRHVRTHTGEKPYKCKYCTRAFAQSNDHVKHLRTHVGDNVYRCELCPSAFRFASELRIHIVTHKNENEETRERNIKALKEELAKLEIKLAEKQVPV